MVMAMISANVAPLTRFIRAITSAFLLLRSSLVAARFLARPACFAALALFAGLRLALVCTAPDSGVVVLSVSIVFVLTMFLLDRFAVRHIHHSAREK
jgi:hypothetical protein